MIMSKKLYNSPLIEVEKIDLSTSILLESPVVPVPPHPGAPVHWKEPVHRTPVF